MEIKRNFVKVVLSGRGEVESVELVKSSYNLIRKEFEDRYKEISEDEDELEYLEYLEEFGRCRVNLDKGEVEYGFSEEDCTFYVEYNMNKIKCEILVNEWIRVGCKDEGLSIEFDEVYGSLGC